MMPEAARSRALPLQACVRLNAAAHELRVPDDAIAAGRVEYALVRKRDDATIALLRIRAGAAIDVHVARTEPPFGEIATALPALLARLAARLRLETRTTLRLLAGGASFGGKGLEVASVAGRSRHPASEVQGCTSVAGEGRARATRDTSASMHVGRSRHPASRDTSASMHVAPAASIARAARRLFARARGAEVPRSGRRSVAGIHAELGIPRDYGRAHRLAESGEPRVLACVGPDVFGRIQWLAPRAAQAWRGMRDAARVDGVELQLVSAYRSIAYQAALVRRKRDRGQAIAEILRVSAAPGYSEHHTGRALDLGTAGFKPLEEEFERSAAFGWLARHASRFGFRLSYPRGNPHAIAYEPWHWCYTRV